MHPWNSDTIFSTSAHILWCFSIKMMPPSGRAHPHLHCSNLKSIRWTVPKILTILYTPCSCPHTQQCQPLPLCLLHLMCHPWPTKCQCMCHFPHMTGLLVTRWEFCLFKCQLETWTWLCKIKADEKLDYLLCILGKEGYDTMDWWVLANEALKNDPEKFLDYREHARWWDLSASPCLWARRYHKEVWQIHRWASRSDMPTCLLGTDQQWQWCCSRVQGSMQANLGNPRCWHWAVQATSEGQSWQKGIASARDLQNLLCCWIRSSCNVCWPCGTHHMPHHQAHNPKPQTSYSPFPNCTHQHPPGRHNCPAWDLVCKGCGKQGHWQAKCHSSGTSNPQASHHKPHFHHCEKGKESQAIKAKTEKRPLHNDLFIATMDCRTVGDMLPKEMIINNISSQWCNEAYTVIKLPASTSSKGTASVHVKVDTGAGGNILPLHLFQQLHPKQTSPDGLPIGLDPVWTKLTAYNGSPIPLYGILHVPILWQPNIPGAQPHMIHSYWYIADTPGPALLGLPACERLAVVQVNCTVMAAPPNRSQMGTTPTHTERAAKLSTVRTPKPKCIKSTDDLRREFPDRFTGIGRFLGEYMIRLHPDTHPAIHAPRKCSIALCPKIKEHLAKMEALGVITHVDQPTKWVSSITYIQKANSELHLCLDLHDLNRAIHCDHHKMPTVEEVPHKFANSHYFTKLNAWHGYWSTVLDEESSLLTNFNSPFGRYHFLHLPFGLVCLQDIFQKKMDQFLKECPGCIGITDDITVHGHTEGNTIPIFGTSCG